MGLSASQARFLQLTARKSNTEYQAQQINFQRLQWADKLSQASSEYQDATSNRKMVFSFNGGTGLEKVDVTYNNYKNYMNQQAFPGGAGISGNKMYLVSSSGNKIIVSNQEEIDKMWQENLKDFPELIEKDEIDPSLDEEEKAALEQKNAAIDKQNEAIAKQIEAISPEDIVIGDDGNKKYQAHPFKKTDFMIVPDLDKTDAFQNAIQNGVYYFATLGENSETGEKVMKTESWDAINGGAIGEEYDKADDAEAEAKFKATQDKIQLIDKKLEMQLDKLETERNAIQTEIDSVSKVIDDNIEGSFKVFS